ncbi:MAG: type II toxin-antitoxin system RelE/ParE family toxin [Oscillospiraceae bacterium]|nr:type II toxin-antitoxin system RelE/ParE family toxin [Oscillospiraceae bacterium]
MDSFEVVFTFKARTQLQNCVSYISHTLLNDIAAKSVYQDAMETVAQLSSVAGSLPYCRHPKLRDFGYRIIGFKRHQYVMLYRIDGKTAIIDGIYHQKQDYENIFAGE